MFILRTLFRKILAATLLITPFLLSAREIPVSNSSELNSAISSAQPGEVIVMSNGTWSNTTIDFDASSASEDAPITIRAETPGQVIMNGSSRLTFSRPYLIIEGLYFKQGSINSNIVNFRSDHCRFTNCAVESYTSGDGYWFWFTGHYNRVDHCYVWGKRSTGHPTFGNDDDMRATYNRVDNCYIGDIPSGTQEIFRIWGYGRDDYDHMGDSGSYFTVERNLFYHADGDGAEIVSLKSNFNVVRYNTFRQCRGGIVNRSGNYNTIEGNFILGEGYSGSYGIRISGSGHTVVNNYISDVRGDGLMLTAGEYIETYLTGSYSPVTRDNTRLGRVPRYGWVRDGTFAHNTFVDVGGNGMNIGSSYKSGWSSQQRVLLPENNNICNNIIVKDGGTLITKPRQDTNSPLNIFTFKPNIYEGNMVSGGSISMSPVPSGIENTDPQLTRSSDGLYRPAAGSPAINRAAGSYVTHDMDGQARDNTPDIGSDEVSNDAIIRKPLTEIDVGPYWMGNTSVRDKKDRIMLSGVHAGFILFHSCPNPGVQGIEIRYTLLRANQVTLVLYTSNGKKVTTLANGYQKTGLHRYTWRKSAGNVFLVRLIAGGYTKTIKVVVTH